MGLLSMATEDNTGKKATAPFKGIACLHIRFYNGKIVRTVALTEPFLNFLWSISTKALTF